MKKLKLGKRLMCGILVIAMLVINFMPNVALAAQDNVKKVEYNKYTIYYSDDYFRHPSTEYDPHLATASIIMTDSTVPRENPESANDTEWYQNQPELLHGYFDAIGFENFETNEDYRKRTEFDTIGLAAASRKVDDYTVIAVTVRSGGYFREWSNNVWLGTGENSDYMHEGWYNAANKLIKFLDNYATSKNITGKVKVWIAGFSRGGATSNIAAGLLDNKIDRKEKIFSNGATLKHDDLYAYTFEAPQGANYNSEKNKKPGDPIYNNIWNVVNPNDLVTKVAMSGYGFTRFGTDKYITTLFYDPVNYGDNRQTFFQLLKANGNYETYDGDNLVMHEVPEGKKFTAVTNYLSLLTGNFGAVGGMAVEYTNDALHEIFDDSNWVVKDTKKANYDSNILNTILLESLTEKIGSREHYTVEYQDHLKKLLYNFMNDATLEVEETNSELWSCLITSLVLGAITDTYTSYDATDIASLWAELSSNPTLKDAKDSIGPLFALSKRLHDVRPNEIVTLAKYSKNIFDNHQFEVNIAHLEAQDSYYTSPKSLKLVPLRDNADIARMSFKDFNDVGLYENDGKGAKKVVQLDGTKFGWSTIKQCDDGYAIGYYSYDIEEKVELFAPVNHNYIVNMQSFSKKPWHDVTFFANYYFIGPNKDGRQRLSINSYSDTVAFDSDFVQKGANFRNVYNQQTGTAFGTGNIIIIVAAGALLVGLTGFSIVYINKRKKIKNKK